MDLFKPTSALQPILASSPKGYNSSAETYIGVLQTLQELSGTDPFVSNLNSLEKLWAAWYIYINNDVLATGILFFVTHEVMYFGRSLPWFIIDRISYFNQWKIQDTKLPSDKEQWECFKSVLKLHFMVEALPIWLFHPLCSKLNISIEVPFPSYMTMFAQICLFFVCEDFWHYSAHRLLHYGWFYKHIHKQHHRYAAPFGLTAEYAHPIEVMSLGFGTVGFPIIYAWIAMRNPSLNLPSLHLFTLSLWVTLRLFQAVDSHSGYDFPWSLHKFLPFWAGADHHDDHHHYFIGNYASSFRWLDYFLQTECGDSAKEYREKRMKRRAEMHLKKSL